MTRSLKNDRQGFTIIELLIATTVFSVILLLVTTGFIQMGNAYYRGLLQSRTQQTARNIVDEISRGIQFSGENIGVTAPLIAGVTYPIVGANYGICINGVGYSYVLDKQLQSTPSGADQVSTALISYSTSCTGFSVTAISSASLLPHKELLGFGMRLTDLDVELVAGELNTYKITVGVASGEFDLFNPDSRGVSGACKSQAGKQFCATSTLSTIVQKRVK